MENGVARSRTYRSDRWKAMMEGRRRAVAARKVLDCHRHAALQAVDLLRHAGNVGQEHLSIKTAIEQLAAHENSILHESCSDEDRFLRAAARSEATRRTVPNELLAIPSVVAGDFRINESRAPTPQRYVARPITPDRPLRLPFDPTYDKRCYSGSQITSQYAALFRGPPGVPAAELLPQYYAPRDDSRRAQINRTKAAFESARVKSIPGHDARREQRVSPRPQLRRVPRDFIPMCALRQ